MEVLKRLLYKEWRESWVVMLVLFVMPAVAITMDQHRQSAFVDGLVMFTSFLMPVLVVVWALNKSEVRIGSGKAFSGGLPVRPMAEWLTSTVLPIPVVFALGWWVAWWFSLATTAPAGEQPSVAPEALIFAALFIAPLVSGRLSSVWAGMAAALVTWLLCYRGSVDADQKLYSASAIIIVALGLSLINLLVRRKAAKTRAVWSGVWLVLVLVIIPGVLARDTISLPDWEILGGRPFYCGHDVLDHSCTVETRYSENSGTVTITAKSGGLPGFEVAAQQFNRSRHFSSGTKPMDMHETVIYLLTPFGLRGTTARIVGWELRTDSVRTVCSIPSGAIEQDSTYCWISPDGKQMLLPLPTILGRGILRDDYTVSQDMFVRPDLWLIDLWSGRKTLCEINAPFDLFPQISAGWTETTVVVGHDLGITTYDRRTGRRISTVPLPKRTDI